MTETEKAYIAGIIDGEGSIMLQKFHSNEHPSPCISIASTTLELLTWIKIVVGNGIIKKKKNYNIEKHSDCYSYILKHDNAIDLLKQIHPYLIIESKRNRAKLILDKYKILTPRNGIYIPELLESKFEFYQEFMTLK
ncbi:hypothetical protein FDF26_01680 [Clostridium botulinum]|nr:hypothetical protein [Clostridium botulinum]